MKNCKSKLKKRLGEGGLTAWNRSKVANPNTELVIPDGVGTAIGQLGNTLGNAQIAQSTGSPTEEGIITESMVAADPSVAAATQKGTAITGAVGKAGDAIGSAFGIPPGIISGVTGFIGGAITGGIQKKKMSEAINNRLNYMKPVNNAQMFAMGGELGSAMDDYGEYEGNHHDQGGINVGEDGNVSHDPNAQVEVEGKEVMIRKKGSKVARVFSNRLTV